MNCKDWLREWVPPVVWCWARRLPRGYGWFGDYRSWPEAQARCSGYQSASILEKVKQAGFEVLAGRAAFERDSVLFPEPEYPWPLLACLMHIAAANRGCLRLLDFGGSLGSVFFQNRAFLAGLSQVLWCVVEQEHFVKCGREHFQTEQLRFFGSVEDCMAQERPDAILFSSVLQYLPAPYDVLQSVLDKGFQFVLVDRTAFSEDGRDHITVQKVPPKIYRASYPCHFFNRERFLRCFAGRYEMLTEFPGSDQSNYPATFRGFFFRRL